MSRTGDSIPEPLQRQGYQERSLKPPDLSLIIVRMHFQCRALYFSKACFYCSSLYNGEPSSRTYPARPSPSTCVRKRTRPSAVQEEDAVEAVEGEDTIEDSRGTGLLVHQRWANLPNLPV